MSMRTEREIIEARTDLELTLTARDDCIKRELTKPAPNMNTLQEAYFGRRGLVRAIHTLNWVLGSDKWLGEE